MHAGESVRERRRCRTCRRGSAADRRGRTRATNCVLQPRALHSDKLSFIVAMETAIARNFQSLDEEDDDIFGDEPAVEDARPKAAGNDEDEGMDLFGDEAKPPAAMLDRFGFELACDDVSWTNMAYHEGYHPPNRRARGKVQKPSLRPSSSTARIWSTRSRIIKRQMLLNSSTLCCQFQIFPCREGQTRRYVRQPFHVDML